MVAWSVKASKKTRIQLKFAPLHSLDRILSKYGVLIIQKPKFEFELQDAGQLCCL